MQNGRPSNQARASASKVRTGCITCKARHVKCDEQKPYCRRCSSTGRKCGYEPPDKSIRTAKKKHMTVYVPRILAPAICCREVDSYHIYVAPKLIGCFASPFWTSLVPQMAQSEPAIRHLLVAISAVYRDVENMQLPLPGDELQKNQEALKEASFAMRDLADRIKKGQNYRLITLIACILFTCLDFLRGSVDTAIVHATNGFNILNSMQSEAQTANEQHSPDMTAIKEQIIPVFARLNVLCAYFGYAIPFRALESAFVDGTNTFTSVDDARTRLYNLLAVVSPFIRTEAAKTGRGEVDVLDIIQAVKYERQLQTWRDSLQRFVESRKSVWSPTDEQAVNMLKLHWRCIMIWLSVCLSVEESAVDLHTAGFEDLIALGELLTKPGATTASPATGSTFASEPDIGDDAQSRFCFDQGVIPPLYYAAIKCRNPVLRRRALAVLRRAPLREGLWNRHITAAVAARVIEAEESLALSLLSSTTSGSPSDRTSTRGSSEARTTSAMLTPDGGRMQHDSVQAGVAAASLNGRDDTRTIFPPGGLESRDIPDLTPTVHDDWETRNIQDIPQELRIQQLSVHKCSKHANASVQSETGAEHLGVADQIHHSNLCNSQNCNQQHGDSRTRVTEGKNGAARTISQHIRPIGVAGVHRLCPGGQTKKSTGNPAPPQQARGAEQELAGDAPAPVELYRQFLEATPRTHGHVIMTDKDQHAWLPRGVPPEEARIHVILEGWPAEGSATGSPEHLTTGGLRRADVAADTPARPHVHASLPRQPNVSPVQPQGLSPDQQSPLLHASDMERAPLKRYLPFHSGHPDDGKDGDRLLVTFGARPWGPKGPWHTWKDYIVI